MQCSGVGPALTGIFMVELERTVVPQLSERMGPWERFVDHTITCNKQTYIPHVIDVLNSFHSNMQFTYKEEKDGEIPFLRKHDTSKTAVYGNPSNNGRYLH